MPLRPCKVRATAVSLLVLAALGFTAVPRREQEETKERVDLVVSGGTIVTMDGQRRVIEDGAIAVNHQTIVMVGPRAEIEAKYVWPGRRSMLGGSLCCRD